jgi:hypothetical protein
MPVHNDLTDLTLVVSILDQVWVEREAELAPYRFHNVQDRQLRVPLTSRHRQTAAALEYCIPCSGTGGQRNCHEPLLLQHETVTKGNHFLGKQGHVIPLPNLNYSSFVSCVRLRCSVFVKRQ